MNLELEGKVALITGASRGIGAAVARSLAAAGCNLALTARDAGLLDTVLAGCVKPGVQGVALSADLRDPAVPAKVVADTLGRFGRLDIVVANAGATQAGDFLTLSDEAWTDGFALKFFGHMRLIRAAWPALASQAGSVTIIAGVAGRTPPANAPINGAVNAALLSLTKALADRGRVDGVRVNAISPGQIRTQRFERRVQALVDQHGISAQEAETRMANDFGMIRTGEPEDVADMVSFVASGRAGLLHGALIDLDGGMTKTI